ncbi:MAG: hypothetical protein AB1793_02035 [Candidatus Thermoplasmatota archaeon]
MTLARDQWTATYLTIADPQQLRTANPPAGGLSGFPDLYLSISYSSEEKDEESGEIESPPIDCADDPAKSEIIRPSTPMGLTERIVYNQEYEVTHRSRGNVGDP